MTKIQTTLAFAAVLATGLNADTPVAVSAVTAEDIHELPDFVVTGSLWQSELARTTASVTAFDSERLAGNGTQHFEDIINAIPNLTWTGGTSRPRYIQIRGIGENSQFEGETPDSSVRFLVDDLDFTGLGGIGNLFDVQQVEVLRGPQAGAFGVNAAGGVIKIVTNEPTSTWSGQVEGTIGQDNLISTGFALGGPLLKNNPEELTFRFAVNQLKQDGFRDNQFLDRDDTNERDELNARLKLRWIASEDWQWDGTLFYAEADNGYDEWSLDNTGFDTQSDTLGRDEQESHAGSLRGTWTGLDSVQVTSITTATQTDSFYSFDSDWADPTADGNYDGFLTNVRDREIYSQEIRLDSIEQEDALGWIDRWTLGVYLHRLVEDTATVYEEFDFLSADSNSKYKAHNQAIFGQIGHSFSEDTRLTLGLRAERYKIEIDSTGSYYGDPLGGSSEKSSSLFGGKITLEHDLNADHLIFASAARGYKAGGANVGSFTLPFDPTTYDDETLYNFELGIHSDWFDGAVASKVTAFYTHRQDTQLRDSTGAGGFFRYLTVNGDDAEHIGLEAEATWFISENWSASIGLGLLETSRDSYSANVDDGDGNEITVTPAERDLANAPSFTYNARIQYQSDCGFFANAEVVGSDEYFESNSHNQTRNAFAVFNAAIGYRYEGWTLTVWGKNLFDEDYQKRVFFFGNEFDTSTPDLYDFTPDERFENPADPQHFGVTLNYQW